MLEKSGAREGVVDLQTRKLHRFLDNEEMGSILDSGFEDKDGAALRTKFKEFFEASPEDDFQKRLRSAYRSFERWLTGLNSDSEYRERAFSFCGTIFSSILRQSFRIQSRVQQEGYGGDKVVSLF